MEYFLVRCDSRVIYEHKMFIRLDTGDRKLLVQNEGFGSKLAKEKTPIQRQID